jgi:hypothetical protein
MRWHRHLLFILGVLFLLATALAKPQGADPKKDAKPAKTPNYYPVEVDNVWHYKVTANGRDAKISTRIAKIEDFNGEKFARLESPTVALTEHLSQTDKGVFRHRFNGAEVTPPFKLLPYPAKPGTKWQGEFAVEKDQGKHKYSGEIQAEENIDVPAGKYKALRVVIKLEENGMMIETTYWFAKDVGFVKQTVEAPGLSILLELEKMERKK